MSLSFLPTEVLGALAHLNFNHVSEIRIRRGQPVIIEYKGSYKYINKYNVFIIIIYNNYNNNL